MIYYFNIEFVPYSHELKYDMALVDAVGWTGVTSRILNCERGTLFGKNILSTQKFNINYKKMFIYMYMKYSIYSNNSKQEIDNFIIDILNKKQNLKSKQFMYD